MLRGLSPKVTEKNLRQIIEKLQARGLEVMLAGMLAAPNLGPSYGQAFNNFIRALPNNMGWCFIRFSWMV